MSGEVLAAHEASLKEFREWTNAREARREWRREVNREICREQFASTARHLQWLGLKVQVPLDFSVDTLGLTSSERTLVQTQENSARSGNNGSASRILPASVRGVVGGVVGDSDVTRENSMTSARYGSDGRNRTSYRATPEYRLAAARQTRFGFGLKRRDLSPAQKLNRLKLEVAWFLAVMAVFAGYLTLPGAQAVGANPAAANSAVAEVQSANALAAAYPSARTQIDPNPPTPNVIGPQNPTNPANPEDPGITLNVNGFDQSPSTAVLVFLLITVLSVAPSLLLMMTSFTKIFIVLAMARNALGLNQIPPTQVLSGLAIFLSLYIMSPTINTIWTDAIQPYIDGKVQFQETFQLGEKPIREFMGPLTREEDIALMTRAANRPNPPSLEETPFTTLVPAFMISEVRSAFIIGFVVFIPFLVIDLVVGAALMSMGMMMLPPVMVSLPFKVLLFVMVDGWGMLTQTLIGTYR